MKHIPNKLKILITTIMTAGAGLFFVTAQAAGSATLTLSPTGGSYVNGSNVTVTIRETSTDQINTVQADLTYDQSKLQFVSINTSVSTFDYPLIASGGNGNVSIARGVSNGGTVTGSQTVAAVTFKVLVGSGSSAVTFAGSSAIIRPSDGQNVWNGSTIGGTYSFTTPTSPPTPPATPPSNPSPPPAAPSPSPSSPSTQPVTPTPSPSSTTTRSVVTASNIASQQANPEAPVPASKDIAASSGYLVAVKVVDTSGEPVKGREVTLDGTKTTKTDDSGIASFVGVAAGQHEVEVKTSQGSVKSSIDVVSDKPSGDVQQFDVKLEASQGGGLWKPLIGGGLGLFLLLGVGIVAWKKKVFSSLFGRHKLVTPAGATGIVVGPASGTPVNINYSVGAASQSSTEQAATSPINDADVKVIYPTVR